MNKSELSNILIVSASLISIQICWFFQLVSSPSISNAYGLSYNAVNISSLYVNLGLFAVISLPYTKYVLSKIQSQDQYKKQLLGIQALALLGGVLRLFCNLGSNNGSYWILAFGHSLIGISLVLMSLLAIKLALSTVSNLRRWYINLLITTLPLGLVISQLISSIAYNLSDTYFNNYETAQNKTFYIMLFQDLILLGIFITILLKFSGFSTKNQEETDEIISKIKAKTIILFSLEQSFTLSAFYLQIEKWLHVSNQFSFVNSDANLFLCVFAIGCLFGSACFQFFTNFYIQKPKIFTTITMMGVAFQAALILTFQNGNVGITSFLAFFQGIWIGIFLNISLLTFIEQVVSQINDYMLIYAIASSVMGLLSCGLTILGNYLHFINRDTQIWIYFCESLIGALILFSYALHFFVVASIPKKQELLSS